MSFVCQIAMGHKYSVDVQGFKASMLCAIFWALGNGNAVMIDIFVTFWKACKSDRKIIIRRNDDIGGVGAEGIDIPL